MIHARPIVVAACAVALHASVAFADAPAVDGRAAVQAFFNRYCIECHGAEKAKGKLSLHRFGTDHWGDATLLDDILFAIGEGDMPPEDAKRRPSPDETAALLKKLEHRLDTLSESQVPGVLKRLNRTEYQNTINDLFGTSLDIKGQLPADNSGHGFNNTGEKLYISAFAMDTYYRVASEVLDNVVTPRPKPVAIVCNWPNQRLVKRFDKFAITKEKALILAGANGVRVDANVQHEGYYEFKIDGYCLRGGRSGVHRGTLSREHAVDVPQSHRRLYHTTEENHNRRKLDLRKPFELGDRFRVYLRPGESPVISAEAYPFPLPDLATYDPAAPRDPNQEKLFFAIQSAEVTGPYFDSWPPKSPFYDAHFVGVEETDGPDKCKAIVKRLAPQVFRRPVSDEALAIYYAIADGEYEAGRGIYAGVQAALKAMLCSPDFLFKHEGDGGPLDDYAIASRMSYFLWNSLPDDTLFRLAAEGRLKDPGVRRAQALRMINDPRSDRFVDDFATQWLELHKLDGITPMAGLYDEKKFAALQPHLKRETIAFFRTVLRENLSITNFIDSDFVMINHELNDIYELPARVGRNSLRKVPVKDSVRGGLMTQAGILLMTTSDGEFTNPFYRGAWVTRNLYGLDLEPPADAAVAALKPPSEASSIKENIRLHRQDPQCINCHRKMDPPGLALERFDVMGRWRDTYSKVVTSTKQVPVRGKPDQFNEIVEYRLEPTTPVESDTEHQDGRAIAGPADLKVVMMQDKDKIARNLIDKLVTYAMARQTSYADKRHIDRLLEQSAANEYKLRDLIIEIIAADSFAER